mgnify:CR=1 FL=1
MPIEKIDRKNVLSFKALLLGHDSDRGMIHRSYLLEKIDYVLANMPINLDSHRQRILEKLIEEDKK